MTAVHDKYEYEQLLAAHTNLDLTDGETERLHALAREDRGRRQTLAEVDALHGLFREEARLQASVLAPPEPADEADESYRRLARKAAMAQEELRQKAVSSTRVLPCEIPRARRSWLRNVLYVAAAAAVLLAAILVYSYSWNPGAPDLMGGEPGAKELGRGSQIILLTAEISRDARSISWHDVVGARTYDVRILSILSILNGKDQDQGQQEDRVVLERSASLARQTRWTLSEKNYELLRQQQGQLYLRVVAWDGAGMMVGSTGDLPLSVK